MLLLSKIGGFFARHWKAVIIWTLITAGFLFFVLPNFSDMLPFFGWVAILLFNFLYAILFMIVQFGALIWFMSRGRTYWIMPGETGIGFKDYKGQPEIL
ncbi:MAG: ATPase, partial [Chloroflexota bacterium]